MGIGTNILNQNIKIFLMPASEASREEGNIETEGIIELRELNEALKMLSDFKRKNPDVYGYAALSRYEPIENAISLLADAKKHNNDIAMRSERILESLHNRALHALKSKYSAFIMGKEDFITRITLSISPHITLLIAQLNRLSEMMVQSESRGLSVKLKPYRVYILQLVIDDIKKLVKAIRNLVALEEDLKRKI